MPKVFVHGNPETSAIWRVLVGELAVRGVDDVVTLSPPGFGAPTPDDWDASQTSYRDWLCTELGSFGEPVDLVGHDWGAGHVFGVLAECPDLVRTWAADCIALTHPDYVWHDAAQAWQTPEVGEEVIAMMFNSPLEDRAEMLQGFGMPADVANDVGEAMTATMGECVLKLYRSAAQPALAQLGAQLAASELPPGLGIIATEDHYAGDQAMMEERVSAYGADSLVLEGLGHWWMFEGAAAAADALVAHWSSELS
jgi:pimeloyl-ACP methyl ester carboxylesterase